MAGQIRYCAWCHTYTRWTTESKGEEFCEYDMTVYGEPGDACEDPHSLAVIGGAYVVFIQGHDNNCGCYVANIGDDGVRCCSSLAGYDRHWEELVGVMYGEEGGGTFDPAKWAGSFPRRTAEIVGRIRAAAAAALADKLPVVIIGIVSAYLV